MIQTRLPAADICAMTAGLDLMRKKKAKKTSDKSKR